MSSVNADPTILQLLEALASKLKTIDFHHRGEQERIRSQLVPRIDLLQEIRTGLVTLTNFCQPVQGLPIEILGDILKQTFPQPNIWLSNIFLPEISAPLAPRKNSVICHAISLSSVCRSWREVMFLHPTFWSVIETHALWPSHPEGIRDIFIPRTLDAPLRIFDYNYSAYDVLQTNAHRLRRYILAVDAAPPVNSSRTPIGTPALEYLSVAYLASWLPGTFDPLSLFAPEMPGLKRLLLRGIPSWANLQFTGLTHLALCEHNHPVVNKRQFLDLLRSCPLLDSLVLHHWLPLEFRNGLHHDHREIRLDCLSQLSVNHSSMDSVMSLLSHLTLPPTASVFVTVEELLTRGVKSSTISSDVPLLGDKSTLIFTRQLPTGLDFSELSFDHDFALISAYNEGYADRFKFIAFDSTLDDYLPLGQVVPSIASVFSMINPAHVKDLFLAYDTDLSYSSVLSMFKMMPSVKMFSFHYWDFIACFGALQEENVIQSLETVRIVFDAPPMDFLGSPNVIKPLEKMVARRARYGLRLKAIYLDIVHVPDFEEDDTVRDQLKSVLSRYDRVRRNIDTLEIRHCSSEWLGDARLHVEHDGSSWVHDWDLVT